MPQYLELEVLPAAQKEIWASRDIANMISAGVSLPAGLSAFRQMFDGEPAQVLRAIGYFGDGDLNTLSSADRDVLRNARDRIDRFPEVHIKPGSLTGR
jgi:hypothetical protein